MSSTISQRDLRLRSKEIMDALEQGSEFTVTRGGHPIGQLAPLSAGQRWVRRADFVRSARHAALPDPDRFRDDLERHLDTDVDDPYAR